MTMSDKCEACGCPLTPHDFTPCKDIPDCPLLTMYDRALERALAEYAEIAGRS
jgi:hypothetical protein